MPRQRCSGSTKTAQTLGRRSGRSWKSFPMTPQPPTMRSPSRARYHSGTGAAAFRASSMLSS